MICVQRMNLNSKSSDCNTHLNLWTSLLLRGVLLFVISYLWRILKNCKRLCPFLSHLVGSYKKYWIYKRFWILFFDALIFSVSHSCLVPLLSVKHMSFWERNETLICAAGAICCRKMCKTYFVLYLVVHRLKMVGKTRFGSCTYPEPFSKRDIIVSTFQQSLKRCLSPKKVTH